MSAPAMQYGSHGNYSKQAVYFLEAFHAIATRHLHFLVIMHATQHRSILTTNDSFSVTYATICINLLQAQLGNTEGTGSNTRRNLLLLSISSAWTL